MSTTAETLKTLNDHAEKIRNNERHVYDTVSPGDVHWQGDLGVMFLGNDFNLSKFKKIDNIPHQLVDGNTLGSNHKLKNKDEIVGAWTPNSGNPLLPFILHAPNGIEVEHPVHGDVRMNESGFYAIRCQRQHAEELRRAAD